MVRTMPEIPFKAPAKALASLQRRRDAMKYKICALKETELYATEDSSSLEICDTNLCYLCRREFLVPSRKSNFNDLSSEVRAAISFVQINEMHNAATEIQRFFKGYLHRKKYWRIIEETQMINYGFLKKQSAIRIQSLARGFLVRNRAIILAHLYESTTITLQKHIRGYLVRSNMPAIIVRIWLYKDRKAAVRIQSLIRGHLQRKHYAALLKGRDLLRKKVLLISHKKRRNRAAIQIQRVARVYLFQLNYKKYISAAGVINKVYRGYMIRSNERQIIIRCLLYKWNRAATRIQRYARGHGVRRLYAIRKKTAYWNAYILRQVITKTWMNLKTKEIVSKFRIYKVNKAAASKINKIIRGHITRLRIPRLLSDIASYKMEKAVRIIQSAFKRNHQLRVQYQTKIYKLWKRMAVKFLLYVTHRRERSASKIQSFVRRSLAFRCFKKLAHLKLALISQQIVRGFLVRRELARQNLSLISQRIVRGFLMRRKLARLRLAGISQRIVRGFLVRRELARQNLSLISQRIVRGFLMHRKLARLRLAGISQRIVRGYLARRKFNKGRKAKRRAVYVLRRFIKMWILKLRLKKLQQKIATRKLKKFCKLWISRFKEKKNRLLVIKIQSQVRSYILRVRLCKIKDAALTIQKFERGRQARRIQLVLRRQFKRKARLIQETKGGSFMFRIMKTHLIKDNL